MTPQELRKKQDELDEEVSVCPKCGKEEKWGFLREWGNCNECVAEEMQKPNK